MKRARSANESQARVDRNKYVARPRLEIELAKERLNSPSNPKNSGFVSKHTEQLSSDDSSELVEEGSVAAAG